MLVNFVHVIFSTEHYRNNLSGTKASGNLVNLLYLPEVPFLGEYLVNM